MARKKVRKCDECSYFRPDDDEDGWCRYYEVIMQSMNNCCSNYIGRE